MVENCGIVCKCPVMSAKKSDLMRIAFLFKLIMIAILFSLCEGLCGNGVIEEQEECDCGSWVDCIKDPCCRALVCTLKVGAQCSNSDPCCKDCKFKKKWEVCRSSLNECDLPEHCTGDSSSCPQNIFHRDGKKCSHETGYCNKGHCQTHNAQCQTIFKTQQVTSASAECYMALNGVGSKRGNCGSHQSCSREDSLCGSLQCTLNNGTTPSLSGIAIPMSDQPDKSNNIDQQLLTSCPTFTSNLPLVQDMTKCSQGKVCLNQRCVNLSSVFNVRVKCPSSVTDSECSGHGDCTSRLDCLCWEGWTGPDCSLVEDLKETVSTRATPSAADVPVTRVGYHDRTKHVSPFQDDNYTHGMIFAIVVVSVSIVFFMSALIYCYLFSSPIAKAKESLDSHADDCSIEENSLHHFQSMSYATEKSKETPKAQIRQEVITQECGGQPKIVTAVPTGNVCSEVTRNLQTGHDTVEIHDKTEKVGADCAGEEPQAVTVHLEATKMTVTVVMAKS